MKAVEDKILKSSNNRQFGKGVISRAFEMMLFKKIENACTGVTFQLLYKNSEELLVAATVKLVKAEVAPQKPWSVKMSVEGYNGEKLEVTKLDYYEKLVAIKAGGS